VNSQEIYEAGYAIAVYNVSKTERWWRYGDRVFATPVNVKTEEIQGLTVIKEKDREPLHRKL